MPTYTFTSPRTGSTYNVDFTSDPNEADLEEARADLDLREQTLGQNIFQATTGEMVRGALSVPQGIVGGLGEVASLVPGLQDNMLQRGADAFEERVQDVIPVDPARQDEFAVKAGGAAGQGLGMLATTMATAGLGASPAIARGVGLSTAGLMGAEQGGETAQRYGLTDWTDRAATILGSAGIEAGTEAFGGLGGKNFTEALLGRLKSATRPRSALATAARTVGAEGVEEMVAGQAQDILTDAVVDEDPNRPGFALNGAPLPPDLLSMENLYNRLEEGALGAVGGAVFAGAEAIGSRTGVDEALSLRYQAQNTIRDLRAKETLSPEEQEQLAQVEAEDANVGAWLERQGMDRVRPALDQIIQNPDISDSERSEAVSYAALIDNLRAVENAPEANPEEIQGAREAVGNHSLNKLNPLAQDRQNNALAGTIEERVADLRKKVQEAARRQQETQKLQSGQPLTETEAKDVVLGPIAPIVEQTAQEIASVDPATAESLQQILNETPTEQTDAIQEQIPTSLPVRQPSEGGQGIPEAHPEGDQATSENLQEEVDVSPLPQDQIQEQPTVPTPEPSQETIQPAPAAPVTAGSAGAPSGVAATATPAAPAKPQLRKPRVRLGISVSPREVQRAMKKFQRFGAIRLATVEELSQDQNLRALFPDEASWNTFLTEQLPFSEGLSQDGSGNAVIIPENLAIYNTDQERASRNRTTAGEEAMIRVMMHENWHAIERWIEHDPSPEAQALRERYYAILDEISDQELDDLAQRRYHHLSNWRSVPLDKRMLQSEVLAERREQAELTGEPDSLIEKFLAWLRDVFKTVTGTDQEPTPDELQDLFNAWHRAQKSTQTRAGPVQPSLPERPVTPEMDRAYMDAVERGDMDTAQRMVDEAAKSAGYKQEAWHGTNAGPFQEFDMRRAGEATGGYLPVRGMFFSTNENYDAQFPEGEIPKRKMHVRIALKNPLIAKTYSELDRKLGDDFDQRPDEGVTRLRELGHDGIILGGGDEIIAVNPSQIKSADPVTRDDQGNVIPLSERFNPKTPDIRFSLPELTPEQRQARLAEITDRLSYTPSTEQLEGQSAAQATQDQRQYATDGSDVEMYRQGVNGAELDALSTEALGLAISESPDGPSESFGADLMKYLRGGLPTLNGLPDNAFLKTAIALNLEHSPNQRAQMGIDGGDLRKLIQQNLSLAGRTLQSASHGRLYKALKELNERGQQITDKEAEKEIGTNDFKSVSDDGNKVIVKEVREAAEDLMPNMPVILEAAQNAADEVNYFDMGMEGMDPKLASKITELNQRIERLGQLRAMRAKLTAGQQGPAASLPELPQNLTLAELDKLIAEEEASIRKLVDEVDKAQKKAAAKPRAKKPKKEKIHDNASFSDYANGKETAGLPLFVDLVKKYVQANSFNRDAFATALNNAFKQADPIFIQGVVDRVADVLNGSATEDGLRDDLKKAVNYDARAKRIITNQLAKEGMTEEEIQKAVDPFTELTKQRLKGEISAKSYQEGLRKLGVEEQTAYAMLQKVDQDRAQMADAANQREVTAEARKNMQKAVKDAEREAQKYEKEALREIESTAGKFDESAPDKPKRTSELKRLKDSFLGKAGPPMPESEFLRQVQALNVKPETAQKLATWLSTSRRADAMERYQKALKKAQNAKEKAVESMVKKLGKVKNPTPQKLKQRSKFVNLLQQGMNSGILDSDLVRAAFAQAYDLHGLTPERLQSMADLMNEIDRLPNGMEKETLFLQWNQILNDIAPASSLSGMAFSAYMGYVLQGAGTMIMQTSNLANFLTPLAFAHNFGKIYASTQGTPLKKLFTALNLRRNFQLTVAGMKESRENLALIRAGLSGIATSTGQGLGVTPIELTQTPYETSLAWTPWGQISQFRLQPNKLMEQMGVMKLFRATRFPAWMASRSFQVIRGAEGWSGGVEKNMAFRMVALEELQRQGKTYDQAWEMVEDALNPQTNAQMWQEAYEQADKNIAAGTVHKSARKQRATELVQDKLDQKWNLILANRHRQQSAVANFKTDPITPMGAGAYHLVSMALKHQRWGPFPNPLRFGFLFPRFFINSMEQAYMYSPAGLLGSLGIKTSLTPSEMKERQQRIVQIYGSLENYKNQRVGKGLTGTALLTGVGAMMTAAMQMWDPDDDEPPMFWMTGDVIGRYDRRGILSETGWWAPNTMYIMGMKFNYVNASPQFGMILNAAGNIGDRFMFPELLGTKYNARTKEHEESFAEQWVRPVGEAIAAPMSRSTYRTFYDALDNAMGGDPKKLIRLATQPISGTTTALTLGIIPSLKTFEKAEKSNIQPRSPQDISQTLQAGVPFANSMGLDTGKPLYSPFGTSLTPYSYFTFLSRPQEGTSETKKAADILIDLGVSKQPPKLEYLGDSVVELSSDGKSYLLQPEERDQIIEEIGSELARKIIAEKSTLERLAKSKGRDAVSDKVGAMGTEIRKKVLQRHRVKGQK